MAEQFSLTFVDYLVFGIVLLISLLIGVYHKLTGGHQSSTKEYLLADKNMGLWPVAFSLMASFMSAITLIGVPAENYFFSSQFLAINISYIIGTPIAAFIFLPVFFELSSTSTYEYLEKRFNGIVRRLASSVFMFQMILYMGVVLYAPALALSAVTDLSKWAAIISVGLVCTLYCVTGGIKAVLWADLFQSILMFVVMIMVIVKGTIDVGGPNAVWEAVRDGNRLQFFNLDPDPTTRHTLWSLMLGGIFIYVSIYGVNQTQVQRLLTVNTLKKSQVALFISWPITSFLSISCAMAGLVMYAYFKDCDPLKNKEIDKSDQMLPYLVMKLFASLPGFPGLFIAGIFSGALSTVSSFVNSLAAVTLEDYVKPFCYGSKANKLSDAKSVLISKLLAFFYGLLCLGITVLVSKIHSVLEASLTIFGVVGGPLLALFTLGMCSKKCSSNAAILSFVISLTFGIIVGFGALQSGLKPTPLPTSVDGCPLPVNNTYLNITSLVGSNKIASNKDGDEVLYLFRISYMWYAGLTWSMAIIIAAVCTLLSPNDVEVDDKLVCSWLRTNPKTNKEINSNGDAIDEFNQINYVTKV